MTWRNNAGIGLESSSLRSTFIGSEGAMQFSRGEKPLIVYLAIKHVNQHIHWPSNISITIILLLYMYCYLWSNQQLSNWTQGPFNR